MIDFGKTAEDYAKYRVPFAPRLLQRLGEFDIGTRGQNILDVGAGTGLLGYALRERGSEVTFLDASGALLKRSHSLSPGLRGEGQETRGGELRNFPTDASSPSPQPSPRSTGEREPMHIAARTEALPLRDAAFDVVTAAQCWHWFDRHTAPHEILRVLKRGGRVAVIYQTYIPLPGSIAERTERLILAHRPGWRHANSTGINGQVLRDLQISGFTEIESFSFDIEISFTRDGWQGYIRASSAIGASMSPEQLSRFDAEHASLLGDLPEPMQIPHRVFAAVARKPAARV